MATLCVSSIVHGAMPAGHVCSAVSSGQQKLHARARLSSTSSLYFGSYNLVALRSESKGVKQVATVETRCESKTEEKGPTADIWIGRAAMVGFAAAITSEIVTGKGVLATAGLSTPQPTLALALAALVGGLTAFGVFRSAGSD